MKRGEARKPCFRLVGLSVYSQQHRLDAEASGSTDT